MILGILDFLERYDLRKLQLCRLSSLNSISTRRGCTSLHHPVQERPFLDSMFGLIWFVPTLVLSPNSAIQAQWAARTSLFDLDGKEDQISTDPKNPGLLTSLTYQSVTMPKRGGEDLDVTAVELWAEVLVTKAEADTNEAALLWIADLKRTNPEYFDERLSVYRKQVRDDFAKNGNALWTLHDSARKTLMRLKEKGIGMIILDECHHLLHHWGRVLTELKEFFEDPIVLGLTATPPDFSTVKEKMLLAITSSLAKSTMKYRSLLSFEMQILHHIRIFAISSDLRIMNSTTSQRLMMNSMKFSLN